MTGNALLSMGHIDLRQLVGPESHHQLEHKAKLSVQDVDFFYGAKHALKKVSLDIYSGEVTAFIGPSGCGKTTLLRCFNRSYDVVPGAYMTGRILLDGSDIHDPDLDPPLLRRRFGWVAQKPNPFPWSIRENVAYGPRLHGLVESRAASDELVEQCLRRVGLWDEVKDRLKEPGIDLSGGQQQRLCIARAIAYNPDVLLMDEPGSALDPVATAIIEDLIQTMRGDFTVIIITHSMQQAARLAQRVAMFHLGTLVEDGDAETVFTNPRQKITQDFLMGLYG